MANSDLINKEYKLPSNIIKTLEYMKDSDIEGNKRINNWLESGVATYGQLKRFKNDIENNYNKSEWGDIVRWLNSILNLDRGSIYRSKKIKSDIGLDNMFRKSHFKDSNNISATKIPKLTENMNNNKKVIRLTESELIQLIENKISNSININETVMQPTWDRITKLQNQIGKDELFDNLIRVLDDQIVNNALEYIERQFK